MAAPKVAEHLDTLFPPTHCFEEAEWSFCGVVVSIYEGFQNLTAA